MPAATVIDDPPAAARKVIYCDNAATTYPKPECVYQAIDRYLRFYGGSPGRAGHLKARQADGVVGQTRTTLASLLNVKDPSRMIFTSNATESVNTAIRGLLREKDHVIITDLEHNAVSRPIWRLMKTRGILTSVIRSDADGVVDPARFREAIRPETKLICCVHANNVLGTVQPIGEIGAIARAGRVVFLVDAAQSLGVLPIDIEAMNIDILAFTGHKGLLGPQGTGGLYLREGLSIDPLKDGGTGISSESLDPEHRVPEAYEAGTYNTPGLAGLNAGAGYILETGIRDIHAHETALNRRFVDGIASLKGVRLYGSIPPEDKVGITSLNFDAIDASDVARILDRRFGIMARSGLQCSALTHRKLGTEHRGTVRFSFGYFTTPREVDDTGEALREIARSIHGG